MNRERQIRKIGEKILLGNVEYQIKNVIGFGGSTILTEIPEAFGVPG